MTDISELIANIRAWEAADKAYRDVKATFASEEMRKKATKLIKQSARELDAAAFAVTSRIHGDGTLAAFTALADHAQALQSRIDAAMAICDTNCTDSEEEYRDGINAARDEIYDVLTGESE